VIIPQTDHPICAACASKMAYARRDPHQPGYDVHTFECVNCNNTHRRVVDTRFAQPPAAGA
jgi:hypothetical protein